MKKIFSWIIFLTLWIGIVFAANNFTRTWNNWDANVSTSSVANDVLTINGRLDIEPSTSSDYINNNYRWKISWTITSQLFGDFTVPTLKLLFDTTSVNSLCGSSLEQYKFETGTVITSPFWWDMVIQSDSFFCSNQYTYINLKSDSLWNKEIWDSWQTTTSDDFGKQQIAISWIAKLKGTTDDEILARWDQNVNTVSIDTQSKILAKAIINKNVYSVMKNLLNNTTLNKATTSDSISNDFRNNTNKNAYYLYDYSSQSDEVIKIDVSIDASWVYKNKWKIFSIEWWGDWKIWVKWKNTLIMQWWNVYINANIYNINDNSLLVIVSKKSKTWKWWNIYIDPDVTNIDAVLIAEGSLISAFIPSASSWKQIQTIASYKNNLRKQLLIYGSVLSSNSVWTDIIPYWADYYQKLPSNTMTDSIYDLWNLRTFNLNYWVWDVDWDWTDDDTRLYPIDWSWWYKEYAWAWRCKWYNQWTPWYNALNCDSSLRTSKKKNPLIIEYNSHIKQISPYILQQH